MLLTTADAGFAERSALDANGHATGDGWVGVGGRLLNQCQE
jgi:hypothetical protein